MRGHRGIRIVAAGLAVSATVAVGAIAGPGRAGAVVNFASPVTLDALGLENPTAVAVDSAGDVFVADSTHTRVLESARSGGVYSAPTTLPFSSLGDPAGIAVDSNGDVFVADSLDADVVELPKSGSTYGAETTLNFTGLSSPTDVGADSAGDVFVLDTGNSDVVELPKAGGSQVTLISSLADPGGMAIDSNGDVFVTEEGNADVVERPVKVGGGYGTQTTVPFTGLVEPDGVAVDANGDVFVTDVGNDNVVERPKTGSQLTVPFTGLSDPVSVAAFATGASTGDIFVADQTNSDVVEVPKTGTSTFGTQSTVPFTGVSRPAGIGMDTNGDVFIADEHAAHVVEVPKTDGSYGAQSQPLPFTGLVEPAGLAVDTHGDVFVSDFSTGEVSELPAKAGGGYDAQITVGTVTGSSPPELAGVAVDTAGDVFVADPGNADVVEFPKQVAGYGAQQTVLTTLDPAGVAFDSDGNLYVTSVGFGKVLELPKEGAGFGTETSLPISGLVFPIGVEVDPSGDVFVADEGANDLVELPKSGNGYGTQVTLPANVSGPVGLALDSSDNLFVSESDTVNNASLVELPSIPVANGGLTPVTPDRILDTRFGIGAPKAPVGPGGTVKLSVLNVGGVPPSGVSAVVLNVTVTQPKTGGYLTVYPDGLSRPVTSNLNFSAGESVPNLVIAPVEQDGSVDFYNGSSGTIQILADVSGWFASGTPVADGGLTPVTPDRILDTRFGIGAPKAPVGPGGTVKLSVLNVGGVPPSGVGAVVLNVTVTQPKAGGYLTVYPDGLSRPVTSNLNFSAGESVPNLVIAPVEQDGSVDFYNGSSGTVQILADVSGWFASGTPVADGGLTPVTPDRILDTRFGIGAPKAPVGPGDTAVLTVLGAGKVPGSGVGAVVLNVTVTQPKAGGYLTVYPDGLSRPVTSNLNFSAGESVPNLVIAPVGPDGSVDFYNGSSGTVQILADVSGSFSTS